MTLETIARAAVENFPPDKQEIMVAIAGAESDFVASAQGDRLDSFGQDSQERYAPFAWGGFLSFGPWQIFLGVHTPLVQQLSGLTTPGALAIWLFDPANCARVAAKILESQGLEAWSTYNDGQYRQYEIEASAAVTRARSANVSHAPTEVTAISFSGKRVHLDFPDGQFEERTLKEGYPAGEWLRFELGSP